MIHEVDEALHALLRDEVLGSGDIEVVFDAPTRDWAARRNGPTVNVFLYDLREDLGLRRQGSMRELGRRGEIVAEHEPPRWYALSYLVTAWTTRPQDEHRLLSVLLAGLLRQSTLAPEQLTGAVAEFGISLPYTVAVPPAEKRALAEIWSALGGELKPSLDLVVTAPLATARRLPAPQVTDALLLSVTDGAAGGQLEVRRPRFEDEPERSVLTGAAPVGVRRARGEAARAARPGRIGGADRVGGADLIDGSEKGA
ncbi:hypothetical protein P3T36_005204 [Kitasatospora sp. MAP12-15]|uniref:DUF4255 domain-containing protein n=1 Tax=unclassified Kitasatospora TaxID=2633591 RepID=UPI002475CD2F|nr:DUF4255 domain-containing protein [Kitasatospora sp. MAP12-44]MDH6113633.1 hypothetical protein [Kitasatospora sp. MAP12-44]